MEENTSLGLVEVSEIAGGVLTLDEMCKAADIVCEMAHHISRGKYIIIVSGSVGEVESALMRAKEVSADKIIKSFIIRNVHGHVTKALNKRIKPGKFEAIGVVETRNALSAVYLADIASKAASIEMVEIKTGQGIGGKGYFTISGEVGAVKTAVGAACLAVEDDEIVSRIVIPRAHKNVAKFVF